MKKLLISLFLLLFTVTAYTERLKILCTTFPIYIITLNVTDGVNVPELMLPASMGCPHDYTLTPSDMKKIASADVLVINGLGMEEFLGAPLKRANKNIKVVDSSFGIKDLLKFMDSESEPKSDKNEKHKKEHKHTDINPHLFVSPYMAAEIALNIANGLSEYDSGNAEKYKKNAEKYAKKLREIGDLTKKTVKKLKNNRIITQHGAFDYYARDFGLQIIDVIQAHGGEEPSAAEVIRIKNKIKKENVGAIFAEPQYPAKLVKKIADEAGIPFGILDPCATGPDDADKNYYEKVMRTNIEVLKKTLGD